VLFQDMENETSVTFDVGNEDINQIMTVSIIASHMRDVPKGIISSFKNLTNLILRENDLKQWKPEYLEGGENLKYIYITENPLNELNDGAFINTPNLIALAISFTNISRISPDAFEGLTMLENLDLNNNPIGDELTTDTLSHVKKTIKRLNLADIGLNEFPTRFFEDFQQLEVLFLKENLFTQIDAKILPKTLKKIEISEFELKLVEISCNFN
jgi:Leucine-rich repeat (LRR) protein